MEKNRLTYIRRKHQSCKEVYIQKHLESVYGRSFSYGTVVELCVARNCRRRSAKRYKGVAQVTSIQSKAN